MGKMVELAIGPTPTTGPPLQLWSDDPQNALTLSASNSFDSVLKFRSCALAGVRTPHSHRHACAVNQPAGR